MTEWPLILVRDGIRYVRYWNGNKLGIEMAMERTMKPQRTVGVANT